MGRITTIIFVVIGCFIAPWLGSDRFKGIFNYIQEFQGFISPGILAVFLFGLFIKRAPSAAAVTALIMNPIIYGALLPFSNQIAFLNRMAITFGIILVVMAAITLAIPLKEPRVLPVREDFDARPAPSIKILGVVVIVITLLLYVIFW
jgi:SSS family solute:Na+ symporter